MKFILNWLRVPLRIATLGVVALAVVAASRGPARAVEEEWRDPDGTPVERAELVMGTMARVALPPSRASAGAFEAAFAALRDVDATMSLYRPDSELVRVNARAGAHPEPVDATLFALLTRSRELGLESDGAFDVTVLPLLRLWGAYPELSYLGAGSVTAVGIEGLRLDGGTHTVSFARPGMGLDLGGIAKGFALDRARAALAAAGVDRARLDLGGDLAFIGAGPEGAWRAAVRDPDAPDRPLGVLRVGADASLSTSGNYNRDFAHEGWRVPSHIYDPRSGRPVTRDLAVTVWSPDATTADALSTALVVLGPEGARALLAREPGAGALFAERRPGDAVRRVTLAGHPPLGWTPRTPEAPPPTVARGDHS
ncbi:MAG TPA: FAD:protein FMN transferase [Candidatus Binatia bacterium]|jgi:thiamine biosynthesis lipoprotein